MKTLRLGPRKRGPRSGQANWYRMASAVVFAIAVVAAAFAQGNRMPTIDHVSPARDSVGAAPKTFAWTAVKEADSYAIGVWTEFDVLWWRKDSIPTPSVAFGGDRPLEPGTYFWSVSAVRDGRQIADSGLAAFVVRQP